MEFITYHKDTITGEFRPVEPKDETIIDYAQKKEIKREFSKLDKASFIFTISLMTLMGIRWAIAFM